MGIHIELIRVSQEIDLNDGTSANFLYFRIGNAVHRALIDDTTCAAVVAETVSHGRQPQPVMTMQEHPAPQEEEGPREPMEMERQPDGSIAAIFGGEEEPPLPTPHLLQQRRPAAQRRVEKDEYGYPILRGDQEEDPAASVMGSERGEASQG